MRLHCGFIKSEYLDVGSGKYLSAANQTAIILIFKNITFFRNCLLCLSLGVFYREIVWVVCCGFFVNDFAID